MAHGIDQISRSERLGVSMVKKEKKMTERKSNQFMQKTIYAKKSPAAHFSVGFLTSPFGAPFNNDDEI